jgi:hypothetical protein
VDYDACKQLLCQLDPVDLRARLDASPWTHADMRQSWLKEAAAAFSIRLRKGVGVKERRVKGKSEVVEEVMQAVCKYRAQGAHVLPNRRYNIEFWGTPDMASSLLNVPVRRAATGSRNSLPPSLSAQRQAELDSAVDLASCKCLLTSLDPADLRRRLEASPWSVKHRLLGKSWLREAADAFVVPVHFKNAKGNMTQKRKATLVTDVLKAVAASRGVEPGSAAAQDESRRLDRSSALRKSWEVRAAEANIALLPRGRKAEFIKFL